MSRRERRQGNEVFSTGQAMFAALQLFPEQASTHAERVDAFFFFMMAVSAFFSVLIAALIIYFAVKYRRRSDKDRPAHIEGSLTLEIAWTGIPLLLTMIMFYWGAKLYFDIARPPANCMEIYVVAKQWMWKLQHQKGQREINQLHVPVGKPVKLTMISQDVIHDFAVPAFRLKQDVIPGRYTTTWFEATRPGEYHIFCDQYCGTNHSIMIGKVVVMPQADFGKWLARGPDDSLAAKGGRLFRKLQCITCHSMDSQARAPALEGLYGRTVHLRDGREVTADDGYIRKSILYPDADIVAGFEPIMPVYELKNDGGREQESQQLSEEEIRQLISYIKALGKGETPLRIERTPPPAKKPGEKKP
jgi:cytochrome c oxidase subunit 2